MKTAVAPIPRAWRAEWGIAVPRASISDVDRPTLATVVATGESERGRGMADRRGKIGDELRQLVQSGEDLRLGRHLSRMSEEKSVVTIDDLEAAWKKSAQGKAAAKEKGNDGRSPVVKASELSFRSAYQNWYSQALRVVEQLLPDRYTEFRELYRLDKQPKELTLRTYAITDYVHGTTRKDGLGKEIFSSHGVAMTKFDDQIAILASARGRLDSLLADIEGTLESTLLDDELETAGELLKAKHLRSAGIVAGVVLERHLKGVLANHGLSLGRKKSQIGNLNDALKEGKVVDVPRWREIQRLGDIRNLCGHDGEREPTAEEVRELIDGTAKVIATVF
jgi:hypothetical protein